MTFTQPPGALVRQRFEQIKYRSPYLFDFRARDLSVEPRTNQESTFSRASDADGTDSGGVTITYPANFPNWTHTDHGVGLQFGAGSSEDILHYPYNVAPRDISIYLALVDEGLFQADGTFRHALQTGDGTNVNEDDQIVLRARSDEVLQVLYRLSGGAVSSSQVDLSTIGSSPGDRVEVVGRYLESGAVLEWALNGGAFTAETAGGAFNHPASYTTPQLNIGSIGDGTRAIDAELLALAIADGDVSADNLRSQLA